MQYIAHLHFRSSRGCSSSRLQLKREFVQRPQLQRRLGATQWKSQIDKSLFHELLHFSIRKCDRPSGSRCTVNRQQLGVKRVARHCHGTHADDKLSTIKRRPVSLFLAEKKREFDAFFSIENRGVVAVSGDDEIPQRQQIDPQRGAKLGNRQDRRRNNCRLPDVGHVFNVPGTMESCPTYFCLSPYDLVATSCELIVPRHRT